MARSGLTCAYALLLCLMTILLSSSPALSESLEPGELQLERSDREPLTPLEEGPVTARAATCDGGQSRKARQIIQELFLSQLPSSYILPLTCPFHPSLDLLRPAEESKQRIASTMWKCHTCGRMFKSEAFLDDHVQNRHLQHAGQNSVCLADYCDVLDCYHRTVSFDPLTGEVLTGSAEGGLRGSAAARARRIEGIRAAQEGSVVSRSSEDEAVSAVAAALLHPHARRCNDESMSLARLQCESALLRCLPFVGTHANGLPSAEVHALYDRFHASICAPLRCAVGGVHESAVGLVESRLGASRARLSLVFVILLLLAVGAFYFLAYHLRAEFGWKKTHTSVLTAHRREQAVGPMQAFKRWIGLQQKKRVAPSKLM